MGIEHYLLRAEKTELMAVTQRAEKNGAASPRVCRNHGHCWEMQGGSNQPFGEAFDE